MPNKVEIRDGNGNEYPSCQDLCVNGKNASEKKKYCKRKSPPMPASKCPIGLSRKGNDDNFWTVVEDKNGIHRWKKHKKDHGIRDDG